MNNVYRLRRRTFPSNPADCLEKILASARAGVVTGVAFVCFIDGDAYIADTCGEASVKLQETRLMLKALDAKLAKRQLHARE